jgi:hypothetical protein
VEDRWCRKCSTICIYDGGCYPDDVQEAMGGTSSLLDYPLFIVLLHCDRCEDMHGSLSYGWMHACSDTHVPMWKSGRRESELFFSSYKWHSRTYELICFILEETYELISCTRERKGEKATDESG